MFSKLKTRLRPTPESTFRTLTPLEQMELRGRETRIEHTRQRIESLGIPLDQMTIVGSSAMYLRGLLNNPPSDIDIVVPARVICELQANGMETPSGVEVAYQEHYGNAGNATTFRTVKDNDATDVDLITRFQVTDIDDLDSEITQYDANFDTIVPFTELHGMRVATTDYIYEQLNKRSDSKAKMHRGLVESALRGQGINPKTLIRK